MTLVVVEDLRKHFGAQEVLSGATLQLDEGERVGLVGPNGAGKSTLVAMIAGFETPDWGKVQRRKGVKIGHVPQRQGGEVPHVSGLGASVKEQYDRRAFVAPVQPVQPQPLLPTAQQLANGNRRGGEVKGRQWRLATPKSDLCDAAGLIEHSIKHQCFGFWEDTHTHTPCFVGC